MIKVQNLTVEKLQSILNDANPKSPVELWVETADHSYVLDITKISISEDTKPVGLMAFDEDE